MATRVRTIEIPFAHLNNLAAATRFDFAAITIPIPMTGSRTFLSVRLEVACSDNASATASCASRLLGIKLGAAAFDDQTVTQTVTSSGEKTSPIYSRDVTAYFNANFGSGTSQTCQAAFSYTEVTSTLLYNNITAKLIITFAFDDAHASASTRVNLVRIPLESNTTVMPVGLSVARNSIGTNQIPQLSTLLPESGKVFKKVWVELEGNDACTATVSCRYGWALDLAAETNFEDVAQGLNSGFWARFFAILDETTVPAAAHDFVFTTLILSGTTAPKFPHLSAVLYVLYEYDHAASTRITVSTVLGGAAAGQVGTTSEPTRVLGSINVQEANPTLIQSGAVLTWMTATSSGRPIRTRFGAQAFRAWTEQSATITCGGSQLSARFDAGAAAGAGHTLVRGQNDIVLDLAQSGYVDSDTTTMLGWLSARFLVNYTCDKPAAGAGVANTSVFKNILDTDATAIQYGRTSASIAFLDSTNRYMSDLHAHWRGMTRTIHNSVQLLAERLSGEGGGPSWDRLGACGAIIQPSTDENATCFMVGGDDDLFKRYSGDPSPTRVLDPTVARRLRTFAQGAVFLSDVGVWTTSHGMSKTISGTVSGYTGAGGGLTVSIHRADTGEKVASAVTSVGGGYTATVWDDTLTYFARVEQDSSHVGSSAAGAP